MKPIIAVLCPMPMEFDAVEKAFGKLGEPLENVFEEKKIDFENLDIVLRGEAGAQLLRLLEYSEQETTIEGVLRVRGFEDAVVTVHADSANVLVRTPSLSRDQSAQILELVSRETGLLGGNIKIIPIN